MITAQSLLDAGIIKKTLSGVKIMSRRAHQEAHRAGCEVTASAKEKIEALAGKPGDHEMIESIKKMGKITDLRKKILYTFGMLILFRLVGVIPAPGVDAAKCFPRQRKHAAYS